MAVTVTSVDLAQVPSDGGYALVVTGTFLQEVAHHVHLGLVGDATDAICYAGPGLANEAYSTDGTTLTVYSPELTAGVIVDVYVEETDTPGNNAVLASILPVLDRIYSTSLWQFKKMFDPTIALGKRSMDLLTAPDAPKNYLLWTEDFTQAPWTLLNVGHTAGQDDPFGGTAAALLDENGALGSHSLAQSLTGLTTTDWHVFSVYAKAVNRDWIRLSAGPAAQYFNVSDGSLGGAFGTAIVDIQAVTWATDPGWYRCSFAYQAGTATPTLTVYVAESDGVTFFTGLSQDSIKVAFPAYDKWSILRAYRATEGVALT